MNPTLLSITTVGIKLTHLIISKVSAGRDGPRMVFLMIKCLENEFFQNYDCSLSTAAKQTYTDRNVTSKLK